MVGCAGMCCSAVEAGAVVGRGASSGGHDAQVRVTVPCVVVDRFFCLGLGGEAPYESRTLAVARVINDNTYWCSFLVVEASMKKLSSLLPCSRLNPRSFVLDRMMEVSSYAQRRVLS
jgi:hypothetical protein